MKPHPTRRPRALWLAAISIFVGGAIAACSLQDGGVLDLQTTDGGAASDSTTTDSSPSTDGSSPDDGGILDAGATFCNFVAHDAAFFFCADFDDPTLMHGFTQVVTDGGSAAFGSSDASAPTLFESTLANPLNDTSQNAVISVPFDFPDAGDAGISFVTIAFDLRVNSISLDGAAPQIPSANMFVFLLEDHFAIYAPIVGRPGIAPVSEFGTVDFNDASVNIASILDGSTPVGEWNRIRIVLAVAPDGGPSTLYATVGDAGASSISVNLSPASLTSRRLKLFLGPSGHGPLNSQFDFDNVVIRSDKL